MFLVWLAILLLTCFAPTAIYYAVTKKYGGEPIILKGKKK